VSPREIASAERVDHARCDRGWAWAFPGLGQYCQNKPGQGAVLAATGVVDGGVLVGGLATNQKSATLVSAIGLQDVWLYGIADTLLEEQRAAQLRFVPQDTFEEVALAPVNGRVLSRPEVFLGILGGVAAGFGVSLLAKDPSGPPHFGDTPRLFGADSRPSVAYPVAAGTFAATFEQVAIAEEATFRGLFQSGIARSCGQACGWAVGSYVFGGFHATNAFFIDDDEKRKRYLAIGVPYLVLFGQYLSGVYWADGYSLATTVAIHFWYDFLLSAADFLYEPRSSMISAKIGMPF
jgi:membrane protease YdiL (CAAX protease family)